MLATRAKSEVSHARSVLEKVRELQRVAQSALDAAMLDSPKLDALDAMRELGRLMELEAKLTGEIAPKRVEQTVTHMRTPREALSFMDRLRPALEQQAAEDEGERH